MCVSFVAHGFQGDQGGDSGGLESVLGDQPSADPILFRLRDQRWRRHATARLRVTRWAAWWAKAASITYSRVRRPSENRLVPTGGGLSSCSPVRSASRPIGVFPLVSRSRMSGRASGACPWPWLFPVAGGPGM